MMKKNIILFQLSAILFPAVSFAQTRVMPVADVSLLGGQYFLDNSAASFNGRAEAFFSPVVKFSENQELVPVYSGYFNGTQDIQELAGGGVLTRQRQNHSLSVRHVYSRGFDKFKPRASYSMAFTRETADEKWGKGLFDYNTFGAGFEAEHERYWGTITESYDFYKVSYPNYSSLLSQSQGVLDPATFSELSQNSGAAVLDNLNHRLAVGALYFLDPLVLRAGYDFTLRNYSEQSVVGTQGNFLSDKRSDYISGFSLGVSRNMKPLLLSLDGRFNHLSSNQNSYDASRTKYIDDFYGYSEVSLAPAMSLLFKNGGGLSFSAGWTRRFYGGRLSQDSNGAYSDSRINQTVWISSLSVKYPIVKHFFARALLAYQISSSNMKYEANYRYNYRANNYLLGASWEF